MNPARELVRGVALTPSSGFRAVLDEVRRSHVRRGATAAQAVAVNESLDRLHARASIDRRARASYRGG